MITWLAAAAALAASALLALPGGAAAKAGTRKTVGLFGDSVTEGIVIPQYKTDGLAPTLERAMLKYGYSEGGEGLIAANQYWWKFNAYGLYKLQTVPADGWALVGSQEGSLTQPGLNGPSGYSAVATEWTATATATVHDPIIQVMYDTTQVPCYFTVSDGPDAWRLNTQQSGFSVPAEAQIDLGAGTHQVTVHGPTCGVLTFDGIVAQKPVKKGTTQIQIDNDGHSGRTPDTDLKTGVEMGIVQQHYNLTVLLFSYIAALEATPGAGANTYTRSMLIRARLARLHGGKCLIVAPAPLPVPVSNLEFVAKLDRQVAREAGCTYSTALTHVWPSPEYAIKHGLTILDGDHPTAKGYKLVAAKLAPVIARILR